MGDRDPREVELALHELARKELVRPARTSSMEGEAEYGFWHLLVRDVCYGADPSRRPRCPPPGRRRLARAKAGERVEDLADVLAHHYLSRPRARQRRPSSASKADAAAQAIRYLALAGERALALDVTGPRPTSRSRSRSRPPGVPSARGCSNDGRYAAQQQGRLQDARKALEEALDLHREQTRGGGSGAS